MFKIDRGFAINADTHSLVSTASMAERREALAAASRPHAVESATQTGNLGNSGSGKSSIGQSVTSTNVNLMMLDGILSDDRSIRNRIFKDVYFHDAVGGGAVDILSTLPFGSFHLTGVQDKNRLKKFAESTAMTHPMELLPLISKQYLVLGQYLGTKNWDARSKMFTGVVSHDIESVRSIDIPVTGAQPIFDLTLDKNFVRLLQNSKDPRIRQVIDKLPPYYKQAMASGVIQLQPQNTIFVARRTLAGDVMGTSFFERLIPIHLIEKALFRGTIDAANRRQRSILHIQVGGDDDWLPTPDDLNAARDAFLQADMDPQGAIVATRTGVMAQEVRSPTDFWSAEMVDAWISQVKYRALGISDDIITGVASLSTLDASLSIMVNNLRNYRRYIEREVLVQSLFADIAIANDFKRKHGEIVLGSADSEQSDPYFDQRNYSIGASSDRALGVRDFKGHLVNISDYDIPRVVWHQALSPEGDSAYMEMLITARQQGVPVPMSMMAAAAGLNLNEILNEEKNDLATRKRVSTYFEKIRELDPQANGDDNQVVSAVISELAKKYKPLPSRGLASRNFDMDFYCGNTDNQGRRIVGTSKGRKIREERLMKLTAQALAENAKKTNHSIRVTPKSSTTTIVDMGENS